MADVHRTDAIQGEIVHEYDGIEEADNELPLWWLLTFYGAIAFSVLYWFYYHEFEVGASPMAAYATELQERAASGGEVSEELLVAMAQDPNAVGAGRTLFASHCQVCHEAKGQGNIGPNLTDPFWIHGGAPVSIHDTIESGVAAQGMPAWGPTLGGNGVNQLTAFLLSIRNSNVPGKAPQGERWTPGAVGGESDGSEANGGEETGGAETGGAETGGEATDARELGGGEREEDAARPDEGVNETDAEGAHTEAVGGKTANTRSGAGTAHTNNDAEG